MDIKGILATFPHNVISPGQGKVGKWSVITNDTHKICVHVHIRFKKTEGTLFDTKTVLIKWMLKVLYHVTQRTAHFTRGHWACSFPGKYTGLLP